MVAVLETANEQARAALQNFLEKTEGIKVQWFDDEKDFEEHEDKALYELMLEEPKTYIPIEMVKQKLQEKIKASCSNE